MKVDRCPPTLRSGGTPKLGRGQEAGVGWQKGVMDLEVEVEAWDKKTILKPGG